MNYGHCLEVYLENWKKSVDTFNLYNKNVLLKCKNSFKNIINNNNL